MPTTLPTDPSRSRLLEWGPASHDPDNPFSVEASEAAREEWFDRWTSADADAADDN
jgi:hypothetical protein